MFPFSLSRIYFIIHVYMVKESVIPIKLDYLIFKIIGVKRATSSYTCIYMYMYF